MLLTLSTLNAVPTVPIGPDKHPMPMVNLGTGSGQHADVSSATALWLSVGGTGIDTAYMYRNEADVAAGIAAAGATASSVFLTTKIKCGTKSGARAQIQSNLKQLGVDSTDLLLIHFPFCGWEGSEAGSVAATWAALEEALAAGQAKAIGVSNFEVSDLKKLAKTAKVWPPAVNQCSLSVSYHDDETAAYCDAHGIVYQSFSPLCGGGNGSSCSHGSALKIPLVQQVAKSHNVSAAQVALKWVVQQGRPLATAVALKDYMLEDLDLWSWGELSEQEMKALSALNPHRAAVPQVESQSDAA